MKTIIYHNPRCSKSREALHILQEQGEEVEVIEYLKDAPDKNTLTALIAKLGIPAMHLVRTGEEVFKPYKGKSLTDSEVIELMIAHPILIERPIVIKGKRAIIGRPPQRVIDIL